VTNPIQNIPAPAALGGIQAPRIGGTEGAPSFKELLASSIDQVNSMQLAADQAVEKLASGQEVSAAEVLTAVQKADIAFRLMMQIRNKLVQAYQEVQNIRV
jgi:flagellar hook-basal body complex protein FliE